MYRNTCKETKLSAKTCDIAKKDPITRIDNNKLGM
jgi:hypothetical protein